QWSASSVAGLFGIEGTSDRPDCGFFDIFASLVYLFIFLYAMAKLVLVSERYLGQHMLCCQDHLSEVRSMSREWEQTLQLCEADKGRLSGEVATLSEKNLQLESVLAELRNCNLHMIKVNLMRSVQLKQTRPIVPSNVYITNTHFHVTRHVFINEGHLSARNLAGGGSGDVYSEEGIPNVWMKYLKMRKCYMGPIADRSLVVPPSDSVDPVLPVVMTTEQLAEM
ncbi:hypothetical protein KR054_008462, partial [Drosophila jambulina]